MNPFDLRGPQFLLFYIVFCAAVLIVVRLLRRRAELDNAGASENSLAAEIGFDPLQIAYLRGGQNHVLFVAVTSLIDRGFLEITDSGLKTRSPGLMDMVRRPVEKALLHRCGTETMPASLSSDTGLQVAVDEIAEPLIQRGLIAGPKVNRIRSRFFWLGLLLLWGVAGTKIIVALNRGKHNIMFLIILAVAAALILRTVIYQFRTAMGQEVLRKLEKRFSGLKSRRSTLASGGSTNELAFLAAMFGMAALPAFASDPMKKLQWSHSGGDMGSSSGCSSGGGGSSCGGGGCGGGGCGGCG